MAKAVFIANTPGLEKLMDALLNATKNAQGAAFKVLRIGAQEWKRRIQRVSPREFGTMSQSWLVYTNWENEKMEAQVGTNLRAEDGTPYPALLEAGTKFIAEGKVKSWQKGQTPIMEWKAKMRDIASFRRTYDKTRVVTKGARMGQTEIVEYGGGRSKADSYKHEVATGQFSSAKARNDLHRVFVRAAKTATKAFTAGVGEQMPFIRPTGYDLAPVVVQGMFDAVNKSLHDDLHGKKF